MEINPNRGTGGVGANGSEEEEEGVDDSATIGKVEGKRTLGSKTDRLGKCLRAQRRKYEIREAERGEEG